MNASIALAVGIVRTWVTLYTLGLPQKLRDARRLEIDCDLWEQRQLAGYTRELPLGTAAGIVVRAALGILSDITWRVEAGTSARRSRSIKMNDSITSRGWFILALALAAMPIIMGASRVAGAGGGGPIWGLAVVLAGLVLVAGMLTVQRNAVLGLRLAALGGVALALLLFWMFFIVVPALALVGFIVYKRARRTGWQRSAGAA